MYGIEYRKNKASGDRGPDYIYPNGTKKWIVNNKFHRTDGPAIEWYGGIVQWWINDELLDRLEVDDWMEKNGIKSWPFTSEEEIMFLMCFS